MTAAGPPDGPEQFEVAAERGLTTPRAAGVAGVVFAVLFFLAMLAASMIVRRSRWPRWASLSGVGIAAVLILSVSFFEPIIMLFPAWVAAISVYVLVTGGRQAPEGTGLRRKGCLERVRPQSLPTFCCRHGSSRSTTDQRRRAAPKAAPAASCVEAEHERRAARPGAAGSTIPPNRRVAGAAAPFRG